MKKFWRCYVCNDIHYGVKPPEICPTCMVKNAYAEISAQEAKTIFAAVPGTAFTKDDFSRAIHKFAEPNEFMVNPDTERVNLLLDGMFSNEANHGLKYCPCRLINKDFEEDLKLVCPCNFPIHETYKGLEKGECWCSLFVKRPKAQEVKL